MIALIIIGGLLVVGSPLWSMIAGNSNFFLLKWFLFCAGLALLSFAVTAFAIPRSYDKGQIDALKGIQTHEIQYVFSRGDTIPCDTLYVKIDKP